MAPAQTSRCAIATGGTGSVKMVLTLLAEMITSHVRLPKIEVRETSFQWLLTRSGRQAFNGCSRGPEPLASIRIFRSLCRSSFVHLTAAGAEVGAGKPGVEASGADAPTSLKAGVPTRIDGD